MAQAQAPAPASKSYVAELALASNSIAFSQPSASRSSSRSRRTASPVKGLADLTFDNGFKTVTRSQLQDGELGGGMDDVFEKLMEFEQKRQFSQLHPGSARELPGWLAGWLQKDVFHIVLRQSQRPHRRCIDRSLGIWGTAWHRYMCSVIEAETGL